MIRKLRLLVAVCLALPAAQLFAASSVQELIPANASRGARAILVGSELNAPDITVSFSGASGEVDAAIHSRTASLIELTVPLSAQSGPVRVRRAGAVIAALGFTLAPDSNFVTMATLLRAARTNDSLKQPGGIAVTDTGVVFIADSGNHRILQLLPSGQLTTLAGAGSPGFVDGAAATAQFKDPRGLAYDVQRKILYVADSQNHSIRRIAVDGTVTTLAGSGRPGNLNGLGSSAQFSSSIGLTLDSSGNLFVADSGNHQIRKVTPEGAVTTAAGTGSPGLVNGAAGQAQFSHPEGIAASANGVLYVADTRNHILRRIEQGVVTTVAGNGYPGAADGSALIAGLKEPSAIAVLEDGDVVFAGKGQGLRKLSLLSGMVSTLVRDGASIDDPISSASIGDSGAIAVAGAIYIAETSSDAIRVLWPGLTFRGIYPRSGPAAGGTTVRIFGSGFVPGRTEVSFAARPATQLQFPASSMMLGVTPAAVTAGAVDVRVTTPSQSATLPRAFTYGPSLSEIRITPATVTLGVGGSQQLQATGFYSDGTSRDLTSLVAWSSNSPSIVSVDASGVVRGLRLGTATVTAGMDGKLGVAVITVANPEVLPPDPTVAAPPINPTTSSLIDETTRFLYTGPGAIQTGVAPGVIDERRVAILRGRTIRRDGSPLSGVHVSIARHSQLGQTTTRQTGVFDMAINGGGPVTVTYEKPGFLPVQRTAEAPWRDFLVMNDVVMILLDTEVTSIRSGAATFQSARGSMNTDDSGARRSTLLFPPNTMATMVMPDGSEQQLTTLSVRATEYTVGPSGIKAMPATLPAQSGYTFCAELSVDEAIAANATTVRFSNPVPFYVENFLNFPVGGTVPAGYYDRSSSLWIPSLNGRVIKVLSIIEGSAQLDTNGDAVADDPAILAALGITPDERIQLAALYAAGQSLWRVPVQHFTPWDLNWPYGPPAGARPPALPEIKIYWSQSGSCTIPGSVIDCQNQSLGEMVPITGTPFKLHYQSDRVRGRADAYKLDIAVSGTSLPAGVKRLDVELEVAGRKFVESFSPGANLKTSFTWDGLDAYGRALQGRQPVTVRRSFVYDAVYQQPAALEKSFGELSGIPVTANRARQEISLAQDWKGSVGSIDALRLGLSGWSLDVHHTYDIAAKEVLMGNGQRSGDSRGALDQAIRRVAGRGSPGSSGDGGPATAANISNPLGPAVGPDGSLYIPTGLTVRRVAADGIISTFAGSDNLGFGGDGGPATSAKLSARSVAVGPDGSVYIADSLNLRIRKVSSSGIISTVAGNGQPGAEGDGGPATEAQLDSPLDIAVGPDGSLYIGLQRRIRRVDSNGIITTLIGGFFESFNGDSLPARATAVSRVEGVAVGTDGSIYFSDTRNNRIRKIGTNGIVSTLAGTGDAMPFDLFPVPDGVPALTSALDRPSDIAIGADGSVYFMDHLTPHPFSGINDMFNGVCRRLSPDGILTTVAGGRSAIDRKEAVPTTLEFRNPFGVAVGPDGGIFIASSKTHEMFKVDQLHTGFTGAEFAVPSSDGSVIDLFDKSGRHLAVRDALLGINLYRFSYDALGQLASITDADGRITTIERSSAGVFSGIVAPTGQRSVVTRNAEGYVSAIQNPAGETYAFEYLPGGLLGVMKNPKGNSYRFTYDGDGRLAKDEDPAGGFKSLSRTSNASSTNIVVKDAQQRTTSYLDAELRSGEKTRTVTSPNGLTASSIRSKDGTSSVTTPDGSVITSRETADPLFGLRSPLESTTVTTPGGKRLTLSRSRQSSGTLLDVQSVTEFTFVNGRSYRSTFDKPTLTFTDRSPAGRTSVMRLNGAGHVADVNVPGIASASFGYDSLGRLVTAAQSTRTQSYVYDSRDRLIGLTDSLGRSQGFIYDEAGRVVRQRLMDGREIGFRYDANGNLTSLTPPGRPAHGFTHTAVDLTESYNAPDAGTGPAVTRYSYNADRELSLITRPDQSTIALVYDRGGRLATLTSPGRTLSYGYDAASGNLAGIFGAQSNLSFSWDGTLPTGVAWTGMVAGSVSWAFDSDFRVTGETVNGSAVTFSYDTDSLLIAAGALTLRRDPANGLLTGTTLGGVTDSYSYNEHGEITGYAATFNAASLVSLSYTRDNGGRITRASESWFGQNNVWDYGYDTAGRLVSVVKDGAASTTYSYDANSNRTSRVTPAATTNATYDSQDRMLSQGPCTYAYQTNGELASKTCGTAKTTYIYDALGNLTKVSLPDGKIIEYVIDARNRRVGKKVNGTLVQGWLYSGQLQIAAELDGAGQVGSRFVYGSRSNVPDNFTRAGITYRILSNHLGSPVLVINTVDGTVAQRIHYDEFGNVTGETGTALQPFGFAGGLLDRDTALTRFGGRDYDAQAGRWTAKDPILFEGGDPNLYGYVFNDPVNFLDREGLQAQSATTVAADTAAQAGAAAGVFVSNFAEMMWVWTIGVDKYYHCMANCEAARMGPFATAVATAISDVRESYDHQFQGQSLQACASDQFANRTGRNSRNQSCESACARFLPRGFKPPKLPFLLTKPGFLP